MKKILLFFIPVAVMTSITFSSCKKDSASANTHTVTYQVVSDAYRYFTSFKYNNTSGELTDGYNVDSTAGMTKAITISTKPFDAKLDVYVVNVSDVTIQYFLVIYVDGSIAKSKPGQVPAHANSNDELEFEVE